MRPKRLLCSVSVLLVFFGVADVASASISMDFLGWVQDNGAYWSGSIHLSVTPDQSPSFTTLSLTTTNGLYGITLDPAIGNQNISGEEFTSRSGLIDSLDTTFTLTLDAGLATQHQYQTTINSGVLSAITPAYVTSPLPNSVVSLTPAFDLQLSPDAPYYYLALEHFVALSQYSSTSVFDVQTFLPWTQTIWTPPAALMPATNYYLDVDGRMSEPTLVFSTPTDAGNSALNGFTSSVVSHK